MEAGCLLVAAPRRGALSHPPAPVSKHTLTEAKTLVHAPRRGAAVSLGLPDPLRPRSRPGPTASPGDVPAAGGVLSAPPPHCAPDTP